MPKNVQIRNLDDATYTTLRARAAEAHLSLAQYLRRELDQLASLPTMADWLDKADRRRAKYGGVDSAAVERAFEEMRSERGD